MLTVIFAIGIQNLLDNDHGERGLMRLAFLAIIVLGVGLSIVGFARGPFASPKR
jgi:hydrogenase/urease accessory protein HupE